MIWWPVHLRPTRLNADVDTSMSQDSISFEGSCSLALPRFSPHCRNSENSKANRIETMKGPAESGQICSVGRRKIAKKIAKNKRCYANTLRPRSRMLLKVMKGGLKGVITPWVILGVGGWGVIIPWVNLTVTGNGGRSQRAAGRKTASPPLPQTRKFCRSSSCWATTPVHGHRRTAEISKLQGALKRIGPHASSPRV